MGDHRPRTIVVSEIVQLLLLCEPLWRALQLNSLVSVVGTSIIVSIPAAVILLATQRKKQWAREVLAGFALLGLLTPVWFFAVGDPDWPWIATICIANAIAVSLLFTDGAEQWFVGDAL
jgi:ABC-type dipeptide/oligopeptide/nickel transport system permease component